MEEGRERGIDGEGEEGRERERKEGGRERSDNNNKRGDLSPHVNSSLHP